MIGVCTHMDQPNGNGMIYPRLEMIKAIEKYRLDHMEGGRAVGEHLHDFGEATRDVDIDKITHRVKDITIGKNEVRAHVEFFNNEASRQLFEKSQGRPFRFGLRGVGHVKGNIIKDIEIVAIDVMIDNES